MNILITGVTGFIGKELITYLHQHKDYSLKAALRHSTTFPIPSVIVGDLLPNTDWSNALTKIDTIIHLAARAHVLKEKSEDPLTAFRETNTSASLNLAKQAVDAGVRRFIFISSIGVNGNQTFARPFTALDTPNPTEPYAISKNEAELGLKQIAAQAGMEVVIIRPPLVYGANAPGNFGQLIKTIASGIPLPFGSTHNQRSLISVHNLIDLITTCIDHPAATNQTFLVSDDEDLSTDELIRKIGNAINKPARLIPIPIWMLRFGAKILGKQEKAEKLLGNLKVDITHTKETLGWKPPYSVDEAMNFLK